MIAAGLYFMASNWQERKECLGGHQKTFGCYSVSTSCPGRIALPFATTHDRIKKAAKKPLLPGH
jgi:hypothetical protein